MRLNYLKYVVITLILFALASCSKKSEVNDDTDIIGKGNAILKVNLLGVLDEEKVNIASVKKEKLNMLALNGKKTIKSGGVEGLIIHTVTPNNSNSSSLDALVSFEQNRVGGSETIHNMVDNFHGNVKEGELSLGISSKEIKDKLQAASTPLGSGKRFRLLIYDGTTLVNATDATNNFAVGGTISIAVDAGKSYTWYAISTDETSVPAINAQGVVAASDILNKNFMYANGTLNNIPDGDNNLSIILKHKMVN